MRINVEKLVCMKNYKNFEVGDIIYNGYYINNSDIRAWKYVTNPEDTIRRGSILFENFSEYFCTISELRKKKLDKLNER